MKKLISVLLVFIVAFFGITASTSAQDISPSSTEPGGGGSSYTTETIYISNADLGYIGGSTAAAREVAQNKISVATQRALGYAGVATFLAGAGSHVSGYNGYKITITLERDVWTWYDPNGTNRVHNGWKPISHNVSMY
jgi:hypothetical protein